MGLFDWRGKKKKVEDSAEEGEMSFLDHLEELRKHLFRGLIPIIIFGGILFAYRMEVIEAVFMTPFKATFPTYKVLCKISAEFCIEDIKIGMQALSPYEQFMKAMVFAFFGGIMISFPYLMFELWRFIRPGLTPKEKKMVRWNVVTTSFLFFTGIAFGYFVILPFSVKFFSSFTIVAGVSNNWQIGSVISFIMLVMMGTGVLFQLPIVVYYLTRLGILSPEFLRTYRRHSIVVILILAALLTPPDPMSQILIFIPLTLLYEVGIFVSGRVVKSMAAEEAREKAKDEAHRQGLSKTKE